MTLMELTHDLCSLPGISGSEQKVAEYITNCIKDYCDYEIDPMGNILAHKKGKNPAAKRLMFSAHMDEVGFTVYHINADGTLKVHPVGGIDPAVAAGRHVVVGDQALPGVMGVTPIHLLDKDAREKSIKKDELYVDIGAQDRAQAEQLVSLGESVTYETGFRSFGENYVAGKALDDRAGCAMLIKMIQSDLPYDCMFAFTVQEEIGCIGMKAAAFTMKPDISVIAETTTAGDLAGVPGNKKVCSLGNGPVVPFMDRGAVYDRELYARAHEAARRNNIACQTKEGVYGGTEARSVQQTGAGAKVLAVSLPCRYLHSPSCMLAEKDLQDELRLLTVLAEEFAK